MKKMFLIITVLICSIMVSSAQTKTTYAEVYKLQSGWTAVISQKILVNNNQPMEHNMIPKISERLYITPKSGYLFDTHVFALNYLATLGFKVVEAYQVNGATCFLMECHNTVTLQVTTNWTNKQTITINL